MSEFRLSNGTMTFIGLLVGAFGGVFWLGQHFSPENPQRLEMRLDRIEQKLANITEQLIQAGVHTVYNSKRMDQHDARLDELQRRIEAVSRRDYAPMQVPQRWPLPDDPPLPVLPARDDTPFQDKRRLLAA